MDEDILNHSASGSGDGQGSGSLAQQLEEAKSQAAQNLAGWQRAQADLENFRKRTEGEMKEWVAFGKQAAFVQIVPILDSLQQALAHAPSIEAGETSNSAALEKYAQWKDGLDGLSKQIDQVMKQIGIEKIGAIGKKFDPNYHEAVREVAGEEDGIVAEQYQTGYMLDGKVLRPAQVAITKRLTANN